MAFVEPPGTGVGGIVDQAQAVEAQLVGAVIGIREELLAQPLAAPAFMQRQAGDVEGVGDFHRGVRRQHRVGAGFGQRVMAHHIAVQHADDLAVRFGDQAVLVREIHIVAGVALGADVEQVLPRLGDLAPDVVCCAFGRNLEQARNLPRIAAQGWTEFNGHGVGGSLVGDCTELL
ncbi:hypothetical protein D3C73_900170 [compost metagenome]